MGILKYCCFYCSLRRGSLTSGIFTLVLYGFVLTSGALNLHVIEQPIALLCLSILLMILSAMDVVSSALLIIGVCMENQRMLLPWIFSVTMTTVLDVVMALYLLSEARTDTTVWVLFGMDLGLCCLQGYCILCVISLYQEKTDAVHQVGNRANRQERSQDLINKEKSATSSSGDKRGYRNGVSFVTSRNISLTSSSSGSKSQQPTDLSSISEEPSSYVPSSDNYAQVESLNFQLEIMNTNSRSTTEEKLKEGEV